MSQLVQYIRSLEDTRYDYVKEHFSTRQCRVIDCGDYYMIYASNNFSVYQEQSNEFKDAIVYAVGTILQKNTNEMVCYGFPRTLEIKETDSAPFLGSLVASEYIDGTLIRAFYDGSNWRLSTNGSMNAYASYWISAKSFGELFDDCLSRIYGNTVSFPCSPLVNRLHKEHTYQFILTDPSVHMQKSSKSFIYHVGTFSNRTLQYVNHTLDMSQGDSILVPDTFTCTSYEELVKKLTESKAVQGYIFYSTVSANTQNVRYKLLEKSYVRSRQLIGNTPNMYLRYLECKADGTDAELIAKFPALRYYSSWVEKCLSIVSKSIYHLYVEKFIIKNKTVDINFYYRPIVYELHGNFMKSQHKVTYVTVYQLLSSYHPKRINFILNGLKLIQTVDFVNPFIPKEELEVTNVNPFIPKEELEVTNVNPFIPKEELEVTDVNPFVPKEELDVTDVNPFVPKDSSDVTNTQEVTDVKE